MYRELSPKGIRIPNEYAITAEGYRHFLSVGGLSERLRAALGCGH
jgi:pyruvate,water dikinase